MNQAQTIPTRHHNPNLFLPIVLIGVGVILLLYNLNMLAVDPVPLLLRMWPLLFVVIGLDILLRWSGFTGMVVSGILGLGVVALIIVLLFAAQANPNLMSFSGWAPVTQLRSETVSHPLGRVASAEVALEFNNGDGSVRTLSDSGNLIEGEMHGANIVNQMTQSGDRAQVRISSGGGIYIGSLSGDQTQYAHLRLNPTVPYDLRVQTNSGSSNLDLTDLNLRSLNVSVGSGSSTVMLPRAGQYQGTVSVSSGSARIRIPAGMAVRVEYNARSGSLNARNLQRVRGGEESGVYETQGYSESGPYVILRADITSGSITIE